MVSPRHKWSLPQVAARLQPDGTQRAMTGSDGSKRRHGHCMELRVEIAQLTLLGCTCQKLLCLVLLESRNKGTWHLSDGPYDYHWCGFDVYVSDFGGHLNRYPPRFSRTRRLPYFDPTKELVTLATLRPMAISKNLRKLETQPSIYSWSNTVCKLTTRGLGAVLRSFNFVIKD